MQPFICKALILVITAILCYNPAMSDIIASSKTANHNAFATDLFLAILEKRSEENIVYSPASIQTCLTLAFAGAEGETAEEFRKILKFGQDDKAQVVKKYGEFLKSAFKSNESLDDAPQLKIANRLYVNNQLKIAPQFNKIAKDYFNSEAENVEFRNKEEIVKNINKWVEQQTENKIKNFMQIDAVDDDTSAVLVNIVLFTAKWLHPFDKSNTKKSNFYLNAKEHIKVETMYTDDRFDYVELAELQATALEMPYKDSDISMLIILPNEIEGLRRLKTNVKAIDLNNITSRMQVTDVDVFLPKFYIEFYIDLKEALLKMGLTSMFSSNANFSCLFESSVPQRISDIGHKAFLKVDEAGSEAGAVTYVKIVPMSLNFEQKVFRVDHPFMFVIHSKTVVYFVGQMSNF